MQIVMKEELTELLRAITEDLDIPSHMYEDAVLRYTDIGQWLAREESELAKFDPDIYPQGSFRLGTVVRPLGRDEYDVDLVCHLKIRKEDTTQQELKGRVGKRLEARDDIKKILKSSRRCWLLDYPEQFHMDVLPTIPNEKRLPNGILLTDTELRLWQRSNPIDYADWFKDRMKVIFREKRAAYAKRYEMSIEEVPDYEVKTPLQRVVQLLKRHRDVHFQNDHENRPVSIIITTLAGHAYQNQADLFDALSGVVQGMPNVVERREDGKWWVQNPVDPDENFADKWNEYPKRREAFFKWLEKVHDDFLTASQTGTLTKSAGALSPILGRDVVSRAASSLGVPSSGLIAKSSARSVPMVPPEGNSSHCIPPAWPTRLQYQVSIKGTVYPGTPRSRTKWTMTRQPVPRNCWLRFEARTNVPEPYEVRWQIVNTGQDAMLANGLRGDEFEESNGSSKHVRWEATEYRGTHWIEAFIIRHGVCVARSKPFKVRIRG